MQLSVLLSLLMAPLARAFYPNPESRDLGSKDYTDADITEAGILRAVATFMERRPPYGRPTVSPGQLLNLTPLTPTTLFKAYYGDSASPSRFVQAIQTVIDGNNEAEMYNANQPEYFFYCEQIQQGLNKIESFQRFMYSVLEKPDIDTASLESARIASGNALHIIQKFYSNSNWVELGSTKPYTRLVDSSSNPYPVASRSQPTCKDCEKNPSSNSSLYNCEDNIIVSQLLTSGFKKGLCQEHSQGKCRHGGQSDPGQNEPPTGGINKETSSPARSPHHKLHQKAAHLAIKATMEFFIGPGYGLLDRLGPDKFRKFFNLEGYTLAFVIDVTGSMGGEINDVKTTCIDLLKKYQDSPDAPYNYVLVPFSDPDVGPVGITQDIDELRNMISKLKAYGGGDCPELALTGLELALRKSMPRSQIFLFSDAGAKDEHKEDQVKLLIESTKSKINPLLTGYCKNRRSKRSDPLTSRTQRSSTKNIFEELAEFSGGFYAVASKGGLQNILGLMEMALNAAPVKIFTAQTEAQEISFPVDDLLVEFSVSVKSATSPFNLAVLQPLGTAASVKSLIHTEKHQAVKISSIAERGAWKLEIKPGPDTYVVDINGKSLLDFSYQVMKEENGYTLSIQGKPLKGMNYTVSIRVLGETENITVEKLLIFDENGQLQFDKKCQQTSNVGGRLRATAMVVFPLTPSRLGISGRTGGGLNFWRVHSDLITAEAVQVLRKDGESDVLVPGGNTSVSVLVVNEGDGMDFAFEVKDELGLLKEFSPKNLHLNQGQNITVAALFDAGGINETAFSMATFTAKGRTAYNYVRVPIKVLRQDILITDEIAPQYNIMMYIGNCTADQQHSPHCSTHDWGIDFIAWDEGPTGSLTVQAPDTDHQPLCSMVTITGVKQYNCSIRLACCSASVRLLIMDKFGNSNELLVDFTQPITNGVTCAVVVIIVLILAIACAVLCCLRHKAQVL